MALMPASEIAPQQFGRLLDDIGRDYASASLEPALRECAAVLRQGGFAENFARSATAQGEPWAPHAPATVRRYGPHPLLILSGALLRSVTVEGAEDSIQRVGYRELEVGTSVEYAIYHQEGTANMPARPFLDASEETLQECESIIADALLDAMFEQQ